MIHWSGKCPGKNFYALILPQHGLCSVCMCTFFPPVKFHVLAVCLCLCVRVKRCECTLYIFLLSLRLHLLASLQWLDLSRLLAVCQRRKICARLTSCHCTPLFLTSILLSAFSPSIIHGSVQTFVFCLNNWLKAWSERRDACISVVGGKKVSGEKRLRQTCSSHAFPDSEQWWLRILLALLPLLTSHLAKWLVPPEDLFSP